MADLSYAAYEEWKKKNPLAGGLHTYDEWKARQGGNTGATNVDSRTQAQKDAEAAKEAGLPARTPEQERYWREHQGNTQVVSGQGAPADKQYGYEENRLAGMFRGNEAAARDAEIARRRALNKADGVVGALSLPPDLADIALRDIATGRQRRARGGSTASALGSFNPTASLTGNF